MPFDIHTSQSVRTIRLFAMIAGLFIIGAIIQSCNVQVNRTSIPTIPQSTDLQNTPSLVGSPIQFTKTPEITTPTPVIVNSKVVLIIPPGADTVIAEQLQSILSKLASQSGLLFETRTTLTIDDLNPNLRIIVSLPPDPGLANLAASTQATQFLGINIPGLEPSSNLSIIDSQEVSSAQRGFLAGYIAAAVTYEWRVGVIGISDSSEGSAAQQGFINGVVYFCGLCKQLHPPFNIYPLYSSLPSSANSSEWQAAADTMISKTINTIYIAPGAGDQDLLIHLADAGINIIGNTPPPESISDRWVATISIDYNGLIEKIWDDLMNNKGGNRLNTLFSLNNINETLFSLGRQKMVLGFMDELMSGMIDSGVKP